MRSTATARWLPVFLYCAAILGLSSIPGHALPATSTVGLDKLVHAGVITILDVKCPGSGESGRTCWENLDRLRPHDEVKFVVLDRADYEFARDVITRLALADRAGAVHLSPVHGVLDPKTLSEWVLADRLPARVQLQLHKYIWSPETRGV
jgi:7-carboxy-7-deazaguanine synthase